VPKSGRRFSAKSDATTKSYSSGSGSEIGSVAANVETGGRRVPIAIEPGSPVHRIFALRLAKEFVSAGMLKLIGLEVSGLPLPRSRFVSR
jgi:hypothetical protein